MSATSPVTHRQVLERIRAEYLEMPGMRLSIEQVQRLCGIDEGVCKSVMDSLVATKCLCRNPDGTYVRLTEGSLRPRPLKAELPVVTRVAGSRRAR